MIDQRITDRCKARLIASARARDTITYSALANLLGVANQSVGRYLNAIYAEEIALGHPALQLSSSIPRQEWGVSIRKEAQRKASASILATKATCKPIKLS
jgi:hypothetical protein